MGFIHDEIVAHGHTVEYFGSENLPRRWAGQLARVSFPLAAFGHARKAALSGQPYDLINVHEPSSAAVVAGRRVLGNPAVVAMSYGVERRGWERAREEASLGRDRISVKTRIVYPATRLWQSGLGLRHADHIFCSNFEDRDYLIRHYGRSASEITRVFSGASTAYAAAPRDYRRARRLVFAGTWLLRKGTRDTIAAFATLHRRHPEVELHVLGSHVSADAVLADFPRELHPAIICDQRVTDAEAAAAFAAADIYLLPSLFEGTPLTLIEAMMSGLPVVTTATCGMKDVIRDGDNGLLVPMRSPEAIVQAVERLLDDAALRERLGRTAQRDARANYTWDKVAAPVRQVYERLCKPG
ncbi:MAG TPA: glycosyltransferase family 4 protein [Candidatus Binataceae bacterium]|nr:glycosyltransferase family 4 protein [Candidatus Binataceae bacterium]